MARISRGPRGGIHEHVALPGGNGRAACLEYGPAGGKIRPIQAIRWQLFLAWSGPMACDLHAATVLRVDRFELRRGDGFAAQLPELQLESGQVAALYGPSGVGKTSLLEGMFGLAPSNGSVCSGSVEVLGKEFAELAATDRQHQLRTNMSWVMQDAQAALDPLQPVLDQLRQATGESAEVCTEALEQLGIADADALGQRLPHAISGGQAQRVLLAVALLRKPRLLVADEPSASLDDESFGVLVTKLRQLHQQGTAILLATHDRRLLEELQAKVLVANGEVFMPGELAPRSWPNLTDESGRGEVSILRVKGLKVRFGDNDVLDGVDLDLRRGEVVALVGGSGVGKTTLARVLSGHHRPDAGLIERPPRRVAIQLLSQDAFASLTPGRTLRSMLSEVSAPYFDAEAQAAALSLPVAVLDRSAAEMSGGERRRAALLRAMAVNPDVIVLDEPTASLDHESAVAVVKSLMALRELRRVALVIITHDRDLARSVANRVVTLHEGRATSDSSE